MSDLNLRIAISIHALREEGDAGPAFPRCRPAISIHALREEGDAAKSMWNAQPAEFLSTPSARRATPPGQVQQIRHVDFYPRPPRGGRRAQGSGRAAERNFYPRPPRGGRPSSGALPGPALKISIHALREEGDYECFKRRIKPNVFLSTPSARRATAKTETKSLFSNKLYNILHEFRRALIYNGSKSYPNHAK